jgi:hypothetical protein
LWYVRNDNASLGFPNHCASYRLMTYGNVIQSSSQSNLSYNEEAEEIENFIREMREYHKQMAQALRIQYVSNKSYKERAIEMKISYAQFKIFVEMARQWVAGRLSADIQKASRRAGSAKMGKHAESLKSKS